MTAYDGAYVALAEALDAPLLTCDARLAGSHGHRATIELLR
jgi:predicted nucleic acid-binding protein